MNSKNLICPRCQGQLQFLEKRGVYECPYCGYAEQVIDSDQVKIEKMRIQEELRKSKKEDAKAFKKSKFSKVIIAFLVICAIAMMSSFSSGRVLAGIIALLQLGVFTSAWLSGAGIIKEKFNGMHTVLATVGFVLIIPYCMLSTGEKKPENNLKAVEINNDSPIVDSTPEAIVSNDEKIEIEEVTNTDIEELQDDYSEDEESVDSDTADGGKKSAEVTQINGMRPEFKKTMDSYETFFDEYVAFMRKYTENTANALTMLDDYTKFMTQYADAMEKMEALGEEDLNDAELKYYLEVTGRINQKLLSVVQ